MNEGWERLVPPATAPTAHLDESELAAIELTTAAEKHLADCAWCRGRRDALSDDERGELASLLAEIDAEPAAEDALRVAASFSMPRALAELLSTDAASAPMVQPAQLWRMVWKGRDALGVVLERNSWH